LGGVGFCLGVGWRRWLRLDIGMGGGIVGYSCVMMFGGPLRGERVKMGGRSRARSRVAL
jgi:hypothetical protein